MPSMNRLARPALVVLVLMLVPASLRAENMKHSLELGAGFNFVRFDGETALDYTFGPSVLAGFNLTKRHGVELGLTLLTATPDQGASFDTTVSILRAGYTYNAYPRSKMVSFFRIGLGRFAIDPERDPDAGKALQHNDANLMVYAGGGLRYFFNEWVGMRLSATFDAINTGNGIGHLGTQASGELGVIFLLGGKETEEPATEPPPPTEEKPSEPETPKN